MLLTSPVVYVVMLGVGVLCAPQYWQYIALAGLTYFLVPFNELSVILTCQGKVKLSRIPHLCNVAMVALLCYLFLVPGSSVTLVLVCALIAGGVRAVGEVYLVSRDIRPRLRRHWGTVRRFLREGGVLVLCTLIGVLHHKVDLLMLANFASLHELSGLLPWFPQGRAIAPATFNQDAAMGYYAGAYRFLDMVRICPEFVLATAIPILARMRTASEFKQFAAKVFLVLLGFTAAIMAVFFVFGPNLIHGILGEKYAASSTLLFYLTFTVPAMMLRPLFRRMVVLRRLEKHLIWIAVVSLAINVVMNLYFIPIHGERGAAFTTVLSESVFLVLAILISILSLRNWPKDKAVAEENTGT